jgi:hypothetical protein
MKMQYKAKRRFEIWTVVSLTNLYMFFGSDKALVIFQVLNCTNSNMSSYSAYILWSLRLLPKIGNIWCNKLLFLMSKIESFQSFSDVWTGPSKSSHNWNKSQEFAKVLFIKFNVLKYNWNRNYCGGFLRRPLRRSTKYRK